MKWLALAGGIAAVLGAFLALSTVILSGQISNEERDE